MGTRDDIARHRRADSLAPRRRTGYHDRVSTWSVTLQSAADEAEDLAAALFDEGASGVEVRDGQEAPMPGVARPPPGRAILVAWFPDRAEADAVAAARGGEVALVPDEDWGEAWKKGLGPLAIGRVFVRPTWVSAAAPPGSVEVVLDPGMAFGTGTHPTTALCLAALSDLLAARPGLSVLDVGTGSGLLAIAARKLGAGRVAATDNDPVAVEVARENATANAAELELAVATLPEIAGRFDLVVANILANTLAALAPEIAAKLAPRGVVLLSGILAPQEREVRDAYLAQGLRPLAGGDRRDGEWSLLALERPGTA
jgi:ribosomal protein L11 methyltransferase